MSSPETSQSWSWRQTALDPDSARHESSASKPKEAVQLFTREPLNSVNLATRLPQAPRASPRARKSLLDRITRAAQDTSRSLGISNKMSAQAAPTTTTTTNNARDSPEPETRGSTNRVLDENTETQSSSGNKEQRESSEQHAPKSQKQDSEAADRSTQLPLITKRSQSHRPLPKPHLDRETSPPLPPLPPSRTGDETEGGRPRITPMKRTRTEYEQGDDIPDKARVVSWAKSNRPSQSAGNSSGDIEILTAGLITELSAKDAEIAALQAANLQARQKNFSAIEELRLQLVDLHEQLRAAALTECPGGVGDLQTMLEKERGVRTSLEDSLKRERDTFADTLAKIREENARVCDTHAAQLQTARVKQHAAESQLQTLEVQLGQASSIIDTQRQKVKYQSQRIAQLEADLNAERIDKADLIKACNDYLQIEQKRDLVQ